VNIIKTAGARLRKEGFPTLKFVVPNSETVSAALAETQAILEDSVARQYVGVIGYHPYPYGSQYASVPNILAASGQGNPNADEITVRNQLGTLARKYNIPVWMTEVSHGEVAYNSFDGLRGRAIHIHDELLYAGASAYFGMNNMWDETAHAEHFGSGTVFDETEVIALIENSKDSVHLTGIAYAIGHYARWFKKGAILLTSTSSDARIQVSAFRDDARGNFVMVLINNNSSAQNVTVNVNGLNLDTTQGFKGEQSTASRYWQPLAGPLQLPWAVNLPALSVTSLSVHIQGGVVPILKFQYQAIRTPPIYKPSRLTLPVNGRRFKTLP
jgi:O-glycosyl hydrolase